MIDKNVSYKICQNITFLCSKGYFNKFSKLKMVSSQKKWWAVRLGGKKVVSSEIGPKKMVSSEIHYPPKRPYGNLYDCRKNILTQRQIFLILWRLKL